MQTLAQFVNYWRGRYCDFDGYYGGQCVDLADFYIRDVWGIPPFFVGGAVDLFGHRPDLIEWITNDPRNPHQFPRPGDLVIWHLDQAVGTGINGHVDIWLAGDGYHFTGLDENWPIGAKPHNVQHDYRGVRGWGRRRAVVPPAPHPVPAPPPAPAPPPVIEPPPPVIEPPPPVIEPPPVTQTSGPADRWGELFRRLSAWWSRYF